MLHLLFNPLVVTLAPFAAAVVHRFVTRNVAQQVAVQAMPLGFQALTSVWTVLFLIPEAGRIIIWKVPVGIVRRLARVIGIGAPEPQILNLSNGQIIGELTTRAYMVAECFVLTNFPAIATFIIIGVSGYTSIYLFNLYARTWFQHQVEINRFINQNGGVLNDREAIADQYYRLLRRGRN